MEASNAQCFGVDSITGRGREIVQESLQLVKRALWPLVGYELFFRLLSFAVLVPIGAWVFATLLELSGRTSVSNFEIVQFLLSFKGILSLCFLGISSFFVFFVEQAGIMAVVLSYRRGQHQRLVPIISQILKQFPRLLGLASFYTMALLAILAFLLLIVGMLYYFLLSGTDINFYLTQKPPRFLVAVGVAALTAIVCLSVTAFIYIRWIFSISLLLEGNQPLTSLRLSFKLTRREPFRLTALLVGWLLAMMGLSALAIGLMGNVGTLLVHWSGDNLKLVIPTVAVVMVVELLFAFVISFLTFCASNALIATLFETIQGRQFQPPAEAVNQKVPARSIKKRLWLGVGTILVLASGATYFILDDSRLEIKKVLVTAHRGASKIAPENTLSAIQGAIDLGADYAEIDVQRTLDGKIILAHDGDLKRVAGVNKRIQDITYAQARQFDVGSWFSEEFKGEKLPSLQEVIQLSKGKLRLNIELKGTEKLEAFVGQVLQVIKDGGFENDCVLTSLDFISVQEAKKQQNKVPAGFITFHSLGDIASLEVDFLSVSPKQLNADVVRRLHDAGKTIHVWTINTTGGMLSLIDLGVDNIITDDPKTLVNLQKELASLTKVERILLVFRNHFEK